MSQLALRRWPNVNPYLGPTSAHQRWANVDLSIGPTLAQRSRANVGPTLGQHRPNVVALTLGQRCANGCMPTLYQHWPNGGCVSGFLWGEPITDGFPSQRARNAGVDVCLNNRLNKQSSWVTGDLRHQYDRRQCNIHMSKDVTVLFRRCTHWSKHNLQKNNGLSLAGATPLSEPTLLYIVNWTLANKLQWKFNRNSYICIQENAFEMSGKMASILSGPHWVNMNQVFMSVYSRSVTMPGLDQNYLLLAALGRFRRKVVLANYGVKKKTTREQVLGRRWVDIGRAMSAQRRFDVGLMSPADVGPTSARRQSQYLNIIIKTNRNVPQRNATIHVCPQRNQITTTDRFMMQASLWNRCKQILAAKSRSWCTQRGRRICCANEVKIGLWIHE